LYLYWFDVKINLCWREGDRDLNRKPPLSVEQGIGRLMLAFRFCVVVSAGAIAILGYGVKASAEEFPPTSEPQSVREFSGDPTPWVPPAIEPTDSKRDPSVPTENFAPPADEGEIVSPADDKSTESPQSNSPSAPEEKPPSVGTTDSSRDRDSAPTPASSHPRRERPISSDLPVTPVEQASIAEFSAPERATAAGTLPNASSPDAPTEAVSTTPDSPSSETATEAIGATPDSNVAAPTPEPNVAPLDPQSILEAFKTAIADTPGVTSAAIAQTPSISNNPETPTEAALIVESSAAEAPRVLEKFKEAIARFQGIEHAIVTENLSTSDASVSTDLSSGFPRSNFVPFERILAAFKRTPSRTSVLPSEQAIPVSDHLLNPQSLLSVFKTLSAQPEENNPSDRTDNPVTQTQSPSAPANAIARAVLTPQTVVEAFATVIAEVPQPEAPDRRAILSEPVASPLNRQNFTPFERILNSFSRTTPSQAETSSTAESPPQPPATADGSASSTSQPETSPRVESLPQPTDAPNSTASETPSQNAPEDVQAVREAPTQAETRTVYRASGLPNPQSVLEAFALALGQETVLPSNQPETNASAESPAQPPATAEPAVIPSNQPETNASAESPAQPPATAEPAVIPSNQPETNASAESPAQPPATAEPAVIPSNQPETNAIAEPQTQSAVTAGASNVPPPNSSQFTPIERIFEGFQPTAAASAQTEPASTSPRAGLLNPQSVLEAFALALGQETVLPPSQPETNAIAESPAQSAVTTDAIAISTPEPTVNSGAESSLQPQTPTIIGQTSFTPFTRILDRFKTYNPPQLAAETEVSPIPETPAREIEVVQATPGTNSTIDFTFPSPRSVLDAFQQVIANPPTSESEVASEPTPQPETPTAPQPAAVLEGVDPPNYLDSSTNPLLFPTQPEEVEIDIDQPITLQQAVELARRNNPTLREARIALDSAREGLREALAAEYPTLSTEFNVTRSDSAQQELNNTTLAGRSVDNSTITTSADARLELNYNLLTGGRRPAQIKAAEERVRLNQLDVERLAEQTRFEVTRAYYNLQEADARVNIEQAAVEDATRTLRDAQLLEQAGLGTRFDVLRAQVDLANSQQNLTVAQSRQRTSRRELATSLGLGQQAIVTAADEIEVAGSWEPSLEETIILAYRNRAELEQELVQRNISEQQREIALSALRPQVSLFANYNVLGIVDDNQGLADGYTVGARLQWTLFEGGAARARAAQEEKNIERAETRFDQQRNQVRLEVEQAYNNLKASEENIQTAAVALQLAEESLRLARLRFSAGVGTQTDVINAQTELTRSRGNLLTAIIEYNQSLAALQRAVSNLPDSRLFDLP
jgi:outer membrane protein TolC